MASIPRISSAATNATGSSDSSASPSSTHSQQDKSVDAFSLSKSSLAVADLIFGIYAIELWHCDESTGKLRNVDLLAGDEESGLSRGGMLLKRRTQESDPDNDYANHDEAFIHFKKLTEPSRRDFLPPGETDPGVGLAGLLWTEQADGIHWRDTGELANDPDQPYDERLQSMAKAGFKLAAGVPFDISGYRGIVIFYGNPHSDPAKLEHPVNTQFMANAAKMLGCMAAIQAPAKKARALQEELRYQNWHKMKVKLLTVIRFGGGLRKKGQQIEQVDISFSGSKFGRRMSVGQFLQTSYHKGIDVMKLGLKAKTSLKKRGERWLKKVKGGGAGIPPPFSYRQAMWTFLGVLLTHTILSRINKLVTDLSDGELGLVLAPLGALTTLQYNLTAAPASQPRNAIFAQIFALTVSILLSYIPGVEPWFRSALAPAIVIPGMAKLGIIHPPAGAAAVVFSSGKLRWEHFGIFLCGVATSIVTAVMVNNLSDKRQYPTNWYLINKAKKRFSSD